MSIIAIVNWKNVFWINTSKKPMFEGGNVKLSGWWFRFCMILYTFGLKKYILQCTTCRQINLWGNISNLHQPIWIEMISLLHKHRSNTDLRDGIMFSLIHIVYDFDHYNWVLEYYASCIFYEMSLCSSWNLASCTMCLSKNVAFMHGTYPRKEEADLFDYWETTQDASSVSRLKNHAVLGRRQLVCSLLVFVVVGAAEVSPMQQ